MRLKFAHTSNVTRFLAGVATVEQRAAREAGWLLVHGEAGFGKTRTVQWWVAQHGAVYLRAKAAMTPHWLLTELVRELEQAPGKTSEELFAQALEVLTHYPRPIVIDEADHALHDVRVLESVRDLSDLTEIPVVLVGMERVQSRIARYRQISSRIAAVVEFGAASPEDVRICCDELCEVAVSDDLAAEVARQTSGRIREVLNAIGAIERQAKRNKLKSMTLADMAGQVLVHDWQARRPRLVKVAS
jgi:DNA transposition AAA+ family ATPase